MEKIIKFIKKWDLVWVMFLSVIGLSLASLFVLGVITFIIKYGT
jgi:hypothetical protein|tara:strand:+ start:412 stop:543 length:132 start_codon:yes stop_codon:yes gene_type:complete